MFGRQDDPNQQSSTASAAAEPAADSTATSNVGTTVLPAATDSDSPPASAPSVGGGLMMPDPQPVAASDAATTGAPAGGTDDLLNLKQNALQQLTPLLGHLDQTPEEKFRTTMMMIQAADNQALLKTAYEAAQAITDEKARAQALLDVVNEINYFTQQHEQPAV